MAPAKAWGGEPLSDWCSAAGGAAQALSAGEPALALPLARQAREALPRGEAGARAAALAGLALLELGRPHEAVGPLTAALAEPAAGPAPALALALGQALHEVGRSAEALPHLEAAGRDGPPATAGRARRLEASALRAAGRTAEAVVRLERLLGGAGEEEAPALALELASALRRVGREAEAVGRYRALVLERPERPEAAAALADLERWRGAGGPVSPLTAEDHLERAGHLVARALPAAGLAEVAQAERRLDEAEAAPTTTPTATPATVALAQAQAPAARRSEASLLRAFALLGLGRPEEAAAVAASLDASGLPAGVRRGATWVQARAAARAGRLTEAAALYRRVAATSEAIPGLPDGRWRDLADESAYLAAWLPYDAGALRTAAAVLARFAKAHPGSRRADDARWFAAWSLVRLGARAEARRALRALEPGPLRAASWYWQAQLAPTSERHALLRQAAAAGGDGWYGVAARARLAALPPEPEPEPARRRSARPAAAAAPEPSEVPAAPPLPSPAAPEAEPTLPDLAQAAALLGLGWQGLARAELDQLAQGRLPRAQALALAELASFAAEPELAFRVARDRLGASPRTDRWLYPSPPAAAAADGLVDPDLLLAVMRRESAFRAGVRSGAGAVGLMQLLPRTAARLGQVSGVADDLAPRLAEPDLNAGLGGHYLGLLLDRFGDEAVALAAYNAGPTAAAGWAEARAGLPLDAWIEAIPYKETRAYVKAVLAAQQAYRRLGGRPPSLDPVRPVARPAQGIAF